MSEPAHNAQAATQADALHSNSLNHRIVAATLLVSLVVSALVIALQLWQAHSAARASAQSRLDEIGASIVPSIALSLWQVDLERVGALLDGIAGLPEVTYVDLASSDGDLMQRGSNSRSIMAERDYVLRHGGNRDFTLGTLHVMVGKRQIYAELRARALSIALATTVTLICCALLLTTLFRRGVTRHLETMADYTRALTFETLETPLQLPGRRMHDPPDEIDQMVRAFNRMRENLLAQVALRDRYAEELVRHHEQLEQLVEARTAELAERTLELQQQRDEIQRVANTDSLSGTSTRRHFRELAEHEMARTERSGHSLSILMIDIDHFKRINDAYGHAAGDKAIRTFCRRCQQLLRAGDAIGRWGGEEFVVLLPATESADALGVAERIRATTASIAIGLAEGQTFGFTVSIGVSTFDGAHASLETLLKAADEALYEAKQSGRDRVCASA